MSSSLQVDVITEMELCGLYRLRVVKSRCFSGDLGICPAIEFYWAFSFIRDEQAHDPCPPVAYDLVGAVDTKRMSPVLWVMVGT